jgi:hypothetical protein
MASMHRRRSGAKDRISQHLRNNLKLEHARITEQTHLSHQSRAAAKQVMHMRSGVCIQRAHLDEEIIVWGRHFRMSFLANEMQLSAYKVKKQTR